MLSKQIFIRLMRLCNKIVLCSVALCLFANVSEAKVAAKEKKEKATVNTVAVSDKTKTVVKGKTKKQKAKPTLKKASKASKDSKESKASLKAQKKKIEPKTTAGPKTDVESTVPAKGKVKSTKQEISPSKPNLNTPAAPTTAVSAVSTTAPATAPVPAKTTATPAASNSESRNEVNIPIKTALNAERTRFLQAESALKRGKFAEYQKLKQDLKRYALYPYLLFAEYDRSIQSLSYDTLHNFLNEYPDTPLAEQLRSNWLQNKANKEEWDEFLKAYVPVKDLNLQCYSFWARLNTNADKREVLEEVVPLWLSGKTPPKACEAVFQVFEDSNLLTRPMIWQRIKLAIQEGNEKLARKMAHHIKSNERALVELWIMIHNNPYLVTEKKYFITDHPATLEMIVHGISEIANKKPETAKQIWQQIGKQYAFAERHWGVVVRSIGLSFAKQKHPDAEKWLSKVPNVYATQAVHEWRVRVSLAKEDWQSVVFWLKNFPEALAKEETWQYWQARALNKINQVNASQEILEKLAQTRSFYGFLASQHLQKPYAIAQQKFPLDNVFLIQVAKKESVQRARELYLLGRESKARSEWLTATQYMTDKERHGAAALSLKWGLPNWSILALSKAQNKNDLSLRFPIVHAHHIHRAARENQIDPAYIFALTRQESAFVSNAKSSAGALGLMQLMPGTAKQVAKQHQMPLRHLDALFEPETNIALGSRYLRMMLNIHKNHPILATAAYNAGPGRIKKWLPAYDMAADSWIETIPFKETREYVKNVMTYTVIYKELLGYQDNKSFKLPHIPAKEEK